MCVNELSAVLKMSYMGVKQHCDDLKRRGYVAVSYTHLTLPTSDLV